MSKMTSQTETYGTGKKRLDQNWTALESPSRGRSGRFPCGLRFGFGRGFVRFDQLVAIPYKVLLNLLSLLRGCGGWLGITVSTADDQTGDAESECE
jgi:hypothetical protein